jgi:hypothetical protein
VNLDDRLAQIGRTLEQELRQEFLGWDITRQESGQWFAVLPGHEPLYANSSAELREAIRDHINTTMRRSSP